MTPVFEDGCVRINLFTFSDIEGTLVGFFTPSFVASLRNDMKGSGLECGQMRLCKDPERK